MMLLTVAFDRGTQTVPGAGRANIMFAPPPPGEPFVWDSRTGQWRCHARHYLEVRSALSGDVKDMLPRPRVIHWPCSELPRLRRDQLDALAAWEEAGRRGQIVMPTGTGKTLVALAAMARCEVATLVVAPIRDLMYQWHRRIRQVLGFNAGILGDGRHEIWPVTVTTYDSAYIHMDRMGHQFGLVIFDEEHHLPAPSLRQAAEFCAAQWRTGLTATPERYDGEHVYLDQLIGPVVHQQGIADAKGETLADYQTVRIPVALSDDEQRRYDMLSREIRSFVSDRRKTKPGYRWEDVCKESGSDPKARQVLRAFHAK